MHSVIHGDTHLVFDVQLKDYPQRQPRHKVRVLAGLYTPGYDEGGAKFYECLDNFDLRVCIG